MSKKIKRLQEERAAEFAIMQEIAEATGNFRTVTRQQMADFDAAEARIKLLDAEIGVTPDRESPSTEDYIAANGRETRTANPAVPEIRGAPDEPLCHGQSMREWFKRAQANGVRNEHGVPLSREGTDLDLNAYWGQRLGFSKPGAEMRALGEDTALSAQAITPQAWTSEFVDVLLPNTILDKVGAHMVPMQQESVTVPVFTSTVSPTWLAEAGSISLDANPAFAPLLMFAPGGVKDITQFSIELAQDAYINGGLDNMLANAVGRKMAVVLDTSALLGIAGNTGVPGLNGETGFVKRHYTGDAGTTGKAPTDTTELGVVAELSMKANAHPNAFVSNVGCNQAFERLPLATYGRYFDNPPIVSQMDWVTSENSAVPYVETDPATASTVAQSGGTMTSLYCGPWNQFAYVGWRAELRTRVLTERYIDSGELALFSYVRFSVRYANPSTFSRTIGILPV